jgi:hypothetical protein
VERGGARFAVLDSAPDLLIGLQEAASGLLSDLASLGTSGAVLAGDLAMFPPADLLNFLHNGRRDGVLLARSGGVERAVVLIEGNVAWACSSSPAERLGEVACRMGLAARVPGLHVRPRRTGKPALDDVRADAQLVLGMAEGALTLGQIAAASALGEFETMRVVYRLVMGGLVVLDA